MDAPDGGDECADDSGVAEADGVGGTDHPASAGTGTDDHAGAAVDETGTTDDGGHTDTDVEAEDDGEDGPTPQSAALRRQQRYIGVGGAILGGLALATGTFQRFPDTPALAALAGVAGTALVLWVARRSVFPGEPATGE